LQSARQIVGRDDFLSCGEQGRPLRIERGLDDQDGDAVASDDDGTTTERPHSAEHIDRVEKRILPVVERDEPIEALLGQPSARFREPPVLRGHAHPPFRHNHALLLPVLPARASRVAASSIRIAVGSMTTP
jgi:hypothetical protein